MGVQPLWIQGHRYLLVQLYKFSYFKLDSSFFLHSFSFAFDPYSPCFQAVVAQINHAIGAAGVMSLECKTVVSKYGNMIWEYLIEGVRFLPSSHFFFEFSQ